MIKLKGSKVNNIFQMNELRYNIKTDFIYPLVAAFFAFM